MIKTRRTITHRTLLLVAVCVLTVGKATGARAWQTAPARSQPETTSIKWAGPSEYIAGTPASHKKALRALGAEKGRWVAAYFTLDCGDCDRVARMLNAYKDTDRILALALGSDIDAQAWAKRLELRFKVKAVTADTFEALGATVLPVLVLFENGVARGTRAPSMEKGWK